MQQRQVQQSDSKQDKAAAEAARLEYRKLHEALRRMPADYFIATDRILQDSLVALERLDGWSDTWLAELAPGFGPLRQVLIAIRAQIEEFVPMPVPPSSETISDATMPVADVQLSPDATSRAREPGSRDEAYRQLAQIADYLARTEPHSPVPYVIRRAVEWGGQPLGELLEELISADAESRRLWRLLGVLK